MFLLVTSMGSEWKSFLKRLKISECKNCVLRLSLVHQVTSFHRKALGIEDFSFNIIKSIEDINPKKQTLSIVGKKKAKLT